jgi:hypothetical protein
MVFNRINELGVKVIQNRQKITREFVNSHL